MVMFCLELLLNLEKNFLNKNWHSCTGDNHFVSLANNVIHFTIEQIFGNLKQTELFRRDIIDIFFISFKPSDTKSIQTVLANI